MLARPLRLSLLLLVISSPALAAAPTMVSSLTLNGTTRVKTMAQAGDLFYLGFRRSVYDELQVVDAADPYNPALAWSLNIDAAVNDIALVPGFAFLATNRNNAELQVVDLLSRQVVATYDTPSNADALSVTVVTPYLILGLKRNSQQEIHIFDVQDPTNPVLFLSSETGKNAVAPLTPTSMKGYAAGGAILERGHLAAVPMLTALLIKARADQFQIVDNLTDEFTFSDSNGDGTFKLGCLGDSNTFPNLTESPESFCGRVRARVWHPFFVTRNTGVLGAQIANAGPGHGPDQLLGVIEAVDVDAVILAFGTNDLSQGGKTPHQTLEAYLNEMSIAAAAGIDSYVALTPPIFRTNPPSDEVNSKIDQLNALIQATVPAERVIDFRTGFRPNVHYADDGVHMIGPGHALRGDRAYAKIANNPVL